jgi:hypothetical protein
MLVLHADYIYYWIEHRQHQRSIHTSRSKSHYPKVYDEVKLYHNIENTISAKKRVFLHTSCRQHILFKQGFSELWSLNSFVSTGKK